MRVTHVLVAVGAVAAVLASGAQAFKASQPVANDDILVSTIVVQETGRFAVTSIGTADRGATLGLRVVRLQEDDAVRCWIEVAIIEGRDPESLSIVPPPPVDGRGFTALTTAGSLDDTLGRWVLPGRVTGEQAEAIAREVEAFEAIELPDSPEPIRSRVVTRRLMTQGESPFSITLAHDGEVCVLRTLFVNSGGDRQIQVRTPIDTAAFAGAMREAAEAVRAIEAEPPILARGG